MNYELMSDFDINKAIAEHLGYLVQDINDDSMIGMNSKFHAQYPNTVWVAELDCTTGEQCSAWEQKCFTRIADDAWSIMLKNGIAPLAENGRIYGATTDTYEYYEPRGNVIYSCEDKNPLRAAMIVFLMMSES